MEDSSLNHAVTGSSFLQFGDWIVIRKGQDFALGLHSLQSFKLHAIIIKTPATNSYCQTDATHHKNTFRNCLFEVKPQIDCELVEEMQQRQRISKIISAKMKIVLRHVETNAYLSAVIQPGNNITHIVLQTEKTSQCVFSFQSQDDLRKRIEHGDICRLRHHNSQKYLEIAPNGDIGYEFATSLSLKQETFKVQIMRKTSSEYLKYLCNQDTILIQDLEKGVYIGISQQKPLIFTKEVSESNSCASVNEQYFSVSNSFIQLVPTQNFSSKDLVHCLWEVKKKTVLSNSDSSPSFLVKEGELVLFRHVKTGLYLTKGSDSQSYNFVNSQRDNEKESLISSLSQGADKFFRISNTINYSFEGVISRLSPIFIEGDVKLGSNQEYGFIKILSNIYAHAINENLIPFMKYFMLHLQNPRREYEESSKFYMKIFTNLYYFFSMQIEKVADKCCYLFQITLDILTILRSKMNQMRDINGLTQSNKVIKELVTNILRFVCAYVNREDLSCMPRELKREIVKNLVGLYKVDQNLVTSIITMVSAEDPLHSIKCLMSKFKGSSPLTQKTYLVKTIGYIVEPLRGAPLQWQKLLKKLYSELSLTICEGYIEITENSCKNSLNIIEDQKDQICQLKPVLNPSHGSAFHSNQVDTSRYQEEIRFLEELLKVLFYSKMLQSSQYPVLCTSITLALQKHKRFNRRVTLLIALNSQALYFDRNSSLIQTCNFIFYHQELTPETHLGSLLCYKISQDFLKQDQIYSLMKQVQKEELQGVDVSIKIEYISQLIKTLTIFISASNYRLHTLHDIQIFILRLVSLLTITPISTSNKDFMPILSDQLDMIFRATSYQKIEIHIQLTIRKAIQNLKEALKAIYHQKCRLFSYPCVKDRLQTFRIMQFLKAYTYLISKHLVRKFDLGLLSEMFELYKKSSLRYNKAVVFWGQDRQQRPEIVANLSNMEHIVETAHSIRNILWSVTFFDHDKKLISNLIQDVKAKLEDIITAICLLTVKKDEQFVKAFKIPEIIFQVIFSHIHLDPAFTLPLINFLESYPPSSTALFQQNLSNVGSMIRVIISCIEKSKRSMSLWETELKYIDLLQNSREAFKNLQLIQCMGILHQLLQPSQKVNFRIFEIIHGLPQTSEYLSACRTFTVLKKYLLKLQNNPKEKQFLQQLVCTLSLLFRIGLSSAMCFQHLNNFLHWEEIIKIVSSSDIPFQIKSTFFVYLRADQSLHQNHIQQYFSLIKHALAEGNKHSAEVNDFQIKNIFFSRDRVFQEKCDIVSMEKVKRFSYNKSKIPKSTNYWEFIYSKPFYKQEEGLLTFLQHALMSVPENLRSEFQKQGNITEIHNHLQHIKILVKSSSNAMENTVIKIQKIIIILEEIFPHLGQKKIDLPLQDQKFDKDLIVAKIIDLNLLPGLIRHMNKDILGLRSSFSIMEDQYSSNSSQSFLQSDPELSRHALIIPTMNFGRKNNPNKITHKVKQDQQGFTPLSRTIRVLKKICYQNRVSEHYQELESLIVRAHLANIFLLEIIKDCLYRVNSLRDKCKASEEACRYNLVLREQLPNIVNSHSLSSSLGGGTTSNRIISKRLLRKTSELNAVEIGNSNNDQRVSTFRDSPQNEFVSYEALELGFQQGVSCFYMILLNFKVSLQKKLSNYQIGKLIEMTCFNLREDRNLSLQIKSLKELIKMMQKPCESSRLELSIIQYMYRIDLQSTSNQQQSQKQTILSIVQLYSLFTFQSCKLCVQLFQLIEKQCLRRLSGNQLTVAVGMIVEQLVLVIRSYKQQRLSKNSNQCLMELIHSSTLKQLLISEIEAFTAVSLESQSMPVAERVRVLLLIMSLLHSLVLLIPAQTVANYFKGELGLSLVTLQNFLCTNLFLKIAFVCNQGVGSNSSEEIVFQLISVKRKEELLSILTHSLSIFHNISFLNGSKVCALKFQEERKALILESKYSTELNSQIYKLFQSNFTFLLVASCLHNGWRDQYLKQQDKSNRIQYSDQIVAVFPKRQKVQFPWKEQILDKLAEEQSLQVKKYLLLAAAAVLHQEANSPTILMRFYKLRWFLTALSVLLILVTTLARDFLDIQDSSVDNQLQKIEIILLELNLVVLIFVVLAKMVYVKELIKFRKLLAQGTGILAIVKDYGFTIFLGSLLIAVNIYSVLSASSFKALLYLVLLFTSELSNRIMKSQLLWKGWSGLQMILLFMSSLIFLSAIYSSDTLISQIPLLTVSQIVGEKYYLNFQSLCFTDWRMEYDSSLIMWGFSLYTLIAWLLLMGTIVFHCLSYSLKTKQNFEYCQLCPKWKNPEWQQGTLYSHKRAKLLSIRDPNKHIKYEHGIFQYMKFFVYILNKPESIMTDFEREARECIILKNSAIFVK